MNSIVNVMTDTLYDKIINVELQRVHEDKQIKTIVSLPGDIVDVRRKVHDVKSSSGMPIAIYKGDWHYEYRRNIYGVHQEVKVKATGVCISKGLGEFDRSDWWNDIEFIKLIDYALAKMEKDKQAVLDPSKVITKPGPGESYTRTDTFKGCLISINNNGRFERYHAIYLESDAESTGTYHTVDSTTIKCTPGAMKPSISFTTSIIPGNNCYKMILKIMNLNLDYDIRSVKRVRVTAGYRTQGFQEIFDCPVFSSYIESPNPDGVTVFECLCVGRVDSFADNRPIHFHYRGGKITIKDFLKAISEGLQTPLNNFLLDAYNDLELKISGTNLAGKDTYAENASAVLTWARQIIQKRIAAAEGFTGKSQIDSKVSYPYIHMHLTSDGLFVYALNKPNNDSNNVLRTMAPKDVAVLDAVKGASFNGVALTVKALWNPRIRPGCLFQMQPNIYNGANLPNTITREQFGGDKANNYLYRCVTCSISFSTNGDENEMSLLAIPIVYMDEADPLSPDELQSWEGFINLSQVTFDIAGAYDINFGLPDSKDTVQTTEQKNREVVTTNTNDMFDMDILSLFSNTMDYEIKAGDNLSTLAQKFFKKGNGCCDFNIEPDDISTLPQGVWKGEMDDRAFLWPLIAVLTYRRYLALGDVGNNGYETMERMRNPNMIRIGRKLVIPIIGNIQMLEKCREMFKYAWQAWYENFPSYQGWARDWVTVYQYLGGTL